MAKYKCGLFPLMIFFVILSLPLSLLAQFSPTIRTGRPGQSIGAFTVGDGVLQFQNGFVSNSEEKMRDGMDNVKRQSSTFENVIRHGIGNRFELSGVLDISWGQGIPGGDGRLQKVGFGGRVNLNQGRGAFPAWCLQMRLIYNVPSVITFIDIKTSFVKRLGEDHRLILNLNPVYLFEAGNFSQYKYTLAYNYTISERWSTFIEHYGNYRRFKNEPDFYSAYFDAGFAYLLHKDVQLDISAGYGNNGDDYTGETIVSAFISGGISWRLIPKK